MGAVETRDQCYRITTPKLGLRDASPRPLARLAPRGAGRPKITRTLTHFANRPIAPIIERGPLACPSGLDWTLCAGGIDLVNIEGFLFNFVHRPSCSAVNRKVVIDVIDDLLRLELEAEAHTTSSRSSAT